MKAGNERVAVEPTLRVRVRCTELPGVRFDDRGNQPPVVREPVHLGIQRGTEVIDMVPASGGTAEFTAEFRVGKKADGSPNFLGPFAQGGASDRFFYLSWGTKRRDGGFDMFRRLKIRLGHLRWPAIRRAIENDEPLVVTLRLTDAKGAPLCATPPATHVAWESA